MQAPSAAKPAAMEFIVVEDKENLKKLSDVSPYAKPVAGSAVTIALLEMNMNLRFQRAWERI